jgi:hypothetical protein
VEVLSVILATLAAPSHWIEGTGVEELVEKAEICLIATSNRKITVHIQENELLSDKIGYK